MSVLSCVSRVCGKFDFIRIFGLFYLGSLWLFFSFRLHTVSSMCQQLFWPFWNGKSTTEGTERTTVPHLALW